MRAPLQRLAVGVPERDMSLPRPRASSADDDARSHAARQPEWRAAGLCVRVDRDDSAPLKSQRSRRGRGRWGTAGSLGLGRHARHVFGDFPLGPGESACRDLDPTVVATHHPRALEHFCGDAAEAAGVRNRRRLDAETAPLQHDHGATPGMGNARFDSTSSRYEDGMELLFASIDAGRAPTHASAWARQIGDFPNAFVSMCDLAQTGKGLATSSYVLRGIVGYLAADRPGAIMAPGRCPGSRSSRSRVPVRRLSRSASPVQAGPHRAPPPAPIRQLRVVIPGGRRALVFSGAEAR